MPEHPQNPQQAVKVFYKGESTDFLVFGTNKAAVEQYRAEPNINNFLEATTLHQVFVNNTGRGKEGNLGEASKTQLENEFGKGKKIEDFIQTILKEGEISDSKDIGGHKYSSTNDSKY
ncbi:hypothetical protein ACO0RG_000691 [Hanseniaspora osmophila]|uniref:Restriction of telomere capping protein 3 n=1 Tax=Hanseniaspora osmophila TaxID=56408 RepID=A0A1E5R1E9_9ASCO|nr:Restriction of telomere capping protein 3 [Hanseniaspora osmophila]